MVLPSASNSAIPDAIPDDGDPGVSLEAPFDVSLAPPAFGTDDAPGQHVALASALTAPDRNRDDSHGFFDRTCKKISLVKLEKLYNEGATNAAISLLGNRSQVLFEGTHTVDAGDPNLSWSAKESFLDLIVCVGRGLGLAPAIPNLPVHHSLEFRLDLWRSEKKFTAKHVKLGFDPTESMLWIGRSPTGEDVWLAFVLRDEAERTRGESNHRRSRSGASTTLNFAHRRRALIFLATMLREIVHRDCCINENYPNVHDEEAYDQATNILCRSRRDNVITLNFDTLGKFDCAIKTRYYTWASEAPPEYKEDNFFLQRIPICVTSRYGQDQQIGVNLEQESENWYRDRDFNRIRYLNIAIATRLSVQRTVGWQPVPLREILAEYHDGIYSSEDPMDRREISQHELEHLDYETEGGNHMPLYDVNGFPIQRRQGILANGDEPLGVLVKSDKLQDLFGFDPDNNAPHDEDGSSTPDSPTPFTFYPQAGLRRVGHFQAEGLITKCYSRVNQINREIYDPDIDGEEEGENLGDDRPPAIHGISSQGYNTVMHRTRGRTAQHHDAQVGLVTAALGGAWAASDAARRTADRLLRGCNHRMPHALFEDKIRCEPLNRDLRLENVYYIDVKAIPRINQNGREIFDRIIFPLTNIWNHGTMIDGLKNHMQLFKPEAFPALYKWTTYPLTCLLEEVFRQARDIFGRNKFEHTLFVELCSVVERALNYMHTGNTAVIATTVMNPLWIGRALLKDGFPCINSSVITLINHRYINIRAEYWPFNTLLNRPHSSSRRSHILTYGESHFNNFFSHLCIAVVVARPITEFLTDTDQKRRLAKSIAHHTLTLFIQDCKDLVSNAVTTEINRQSRGSPDFVEYAKSRKKALKKWLKSPTPFAWNDPKADNQYSCSDLLLSLAEDPQSIDQGFSEAEESWTLGRFAEHIISNAKISSASTPAPFMKKGIFVSTLPVALEEMRRVLSTMHEKGPSDPYLASLFAIVMMQMSIDFIPWHAPRSANRTGPAPRIVTHKHWMLVNKATSKADTSRTGENPNPEERAQDVAENTSRLHPSAAWSIPNHLQDMGPLWTKRVLPTDWDIKNASLDPLYSKRPATNYVIETYEWARNNFDLKNWKHQMALVWAILFTAILPNVVTPIDQKEAISRLKRKEDVTRAVRDLPWMKHASDTRKGVTAKPPYLTMVSTLLVSMLDTRSPLHEYLGNKKGFGEHWTDKHSPKGINAVLFVRLGFAYATKYTVLGSAKYQSNWHLKPDNELGILHKTVMEHLTNKEYGVYFAIQEIFGVTMADYAASKGHTQRPEIGTH